MTHLIDTRTGDVVLELDWDRPPLTLNQRLHFRPKAEKTAEVREAVAGIADRIGVGKMHRPAVQLVWLVTTRAKRDEDNLVATLKAACDGLVDAGVAFDDTPEHMHKPMPVIAYAKGHPKAPGLFLVLWEHTGPTAEQTRALDALAEKLGVAL